MAAEMMALIREMQARRPFQPFVIILDDGTRLPVVRTFQCATPDQGLIYAQESTGSVLDFPAKRIAGVEQFEEKPAA